MRDVDFTLELSLDEEYQDAVADPQAVSRGTCLACGTRDVPRWKTPEQRLPVCEECLR